MDSSIKRHQQVNRDCKNRLSEEKTLWNQLHKMLIVHLKTLVHNMKTLDNPPISLYTSKSGHGQPLVFIHGWAASHRFWKNQIQRFQTAYQVLAYDLRGHGDSDKPTKGYEISNHITDLETLLAQERITNPILIGHSLGGMIALQYVLESPNSPRALVLVGTNPHPVPTLKRSIQFSFLSWIISLSRSQAAKFTRSQIFSPDVDPELVDWVNQDSLRTPPHVIRQTLKAVKAFNIIDRLPEIQCPVCIINGEFETAVDSETVTLMIQLMPQAEFLSIPGSGHNVMLEQSDAFDDALTSFLTSLTNSS
jgi:pimeloyl-ACP methyl ester carboxylesterase